MTEYRIPENFSRRELRKLTRSQASEPNSHIEAGIGRIGIIIFSAFIPIVYFVILARSVAVNYSNVPIGDEWDSRRLMNPKLHPLTWGHLWQQHNEHRLVWMKILFYLNWLWSKGDMWPLLWIGFAISLATFALFVLVIWRYVGGHVSTWAKISATGIVGIFIFSAQQYEVFAGGFQTHFFLAVLLPIVSFLAAAEFIKNQRTTQLAIAWLIAVIAMMNNASGTLISLVLLILLIGTRQKLSILAISLGLTILNFLIYFHGYQKVPNTSSPVETLQQHPLFMLQYAVRYLATPVSQVLGHTFPVLEILIFLVYISILIIFVLRILRNPREQTIALYVATCISLLVLMTAVISGGGRYVFGLTSATALRYTMETFVGYSAIVVLALSLRRKSSLSHSKYAPVSYIVALAIALIFFPSQVRVYDAGYGTPFEQRFSALALKLGIHDKNQLRRIYPDDQWVERQAQGLIKNRQSIFASWDIGRANSRIAQPLDINTLRPCVGATDHLQGINGDSQWGVVTGWIYDPSTRLAPTVIVTTSELGKILGYGISGWPRPDVVEFGKIPELKTGFAIYSTRVLPAFLVGIEKTGPVCKIPFVAPKS